MKYTFVVTALLASVTVAAGRQPQFKSGVEVVYLDVTVQAPDGSIVRGLDGRGRPCGPIRAAPAR
jgi:hypothetical protein